MHYAPRALNLRREKDAMENDDTDIEESETPPTDEEATDKPKSELKQRCITGAIIVAVTLVALISGKTVWGISMVALAMMMMVEWQTLTKTLSRKTYIIGIAVIATAIASSILLRADDYGLYSILYVVACVAATDIFAYFGGKKFGTHQLAPKLSPNKTLEGLACGVIAASLMGALASYALPSYPATLMQGASIGALLGFLSQAGDLLESSIKRKADVKDSGSLLPGHGGLLDRADGYLIALPTFHLLLCALEVLR